VVLKAMLKINFPIHFVPFVIFKLKKLRKEGIIKPSAKLLLNILRSAMYMTGYVSIIKLMFAMADSFPLRFLPYKFVDVLVMVLSPGSIAFEQPHRRVDITYFLLRSSVENWWNMLRNRKLVPHIPKAGELLIILAFAIIAFKFSEEFKQDTKVLPLDDLEETKDKKCVKEKGKDGS